MASILLIDDDDLVLKGAQRILRRAGHQVWESTSPKTALHMLDHVPVDVVVTDVYMPGLNGVDLLRQLKQRGDDAARRVIVMTGGGVLKTAAELLAEARREGAGRCIEKPFYPGELVAAVDAVMSA